MKRFITEYAKYCKDAIKSRPCEKEQNVKACETIDKYVMMQERGLITVRECMEAIGHCG